MGMPRTVNIQLKFRAQMWTATSPEARGLLATGGTLPEVLRAAAKALEDLAMAAVWEHAEGREVKPIFAEQM